MRVDTIDTQSTKERLDYSPCYNRWMRKAMTRSYIAPLHISKHGRTRAVNVCSVIIIMFLQESGSPKPRGQGFQSQGPVPFRFLLAALMATTTQGTLHGPSHHQRSS